MAINGQLLVKKWEIDQKKVADSAGLIILILI